MLPVLFSPRANVLDCRADRVALATFRRAGNRLRLTDYADEIFPSGEGGGDRWLENTRNALRTLAQKNKVTGAVTLVLPAHRGFTKLVKVPRVGSAKLARVLTFEAEQSIPFALGDVAWDSTVAGEDATTLEILIAAAKVEVVEPVCAAAHEAGLAVSRVLPASLGILAAFRLAHPALSGPAVMVDVGDHFVSLLLVDRQRFTLRTFRLDVGGDSPVAAERGAAPASDGGPGKFAGEMAAGGLANRLAQEIVRSILHFQRRREMPKPAVLFLSGCGAQVAGLDNALSTRLKMRTEHLDLKNQVEAAPGAGAVELANLAAMAGAAAIELQPKQPGVNLLPLRWRQAGESRARRPWLVAVMVLAVATPVPLGIHYHRLAVEAEKKTVALERELIPLRARDLRNQANLRHLERLNRRLAELDSIAARRSDWVELLADLQERLGRVGDVWLEKLQPVPGPAGSPLKLVVSGRMLDKANPQAKVSPATYGRVRALLASVAESPFATAVEAERFDSQQPGLLKFDFAIVTGPSRPL